MRWGAGADVEAGEEDENGGWEVIIVELGAE